LEQSGRRVAIAGVCVSGALAVAKLIIGWLAGSTSVLADGVESAADVVASGVLYIGLVLSSRPADDNHPYGHGRVEMLTGLALGLLLVATGVGISWRSLQGAGEVHAPPASYALWPLAASVVSKAVLSTLKLRVGRRLRSSAVIADAYNDAVDILSGSVALAAVGLTLYNPARFLAADHYGGFAVGLIVGFLGVQVVRETSYQLMDTMPGPEMVAQIRGVASEVPAVLGIEKCFARKTGLRYHVDLHLEVDPQMTVLDSHDVATAVKQRLRDRLPFVADVLVHVEPHQPPAG
jgi:cation diffusion facilitator family transporter